MLGKKPNLLGSPETPAIPPEVVAGRVKELLAAAEAGLSVLETVHHVGDQSTDPKGGVNAVISAAEAILRSAAEEPSNV